MTSSTKAILGSAVLVVSPWLGCGPPLGAGDGAPDRASPGTDATFAPDAPSSDAVVTPDIPDVQDVAVGRSNDASIPAVDAAVGCTSAIGGFGNGVWPPACFQANGPSSPLRHRLPARPHLDPNSDALVATLLHVSNSISMHTRTPFYFSTAHDPVYTVNCTMYGGRCNAAGIQVHIPVGAQMEGGGDAHLSVFDQSVNRQFDFWATDLPHAHPGGTLNIGWGGQDVIGGAGVQCDAIAGNFCEYGVFVHWNEFDAGLVDHALELSVPCEVAGPVYPSTGSEVTCTSGTNQPHLGTHFALNLTDAEIAALPVDAWQKTLFVAMAHYGMFVGDTGTAGWSNGVMIHRESSNMYATYDQPDPWLAFATAHHEEPDAINVTQGFDLTGHLVVVDPCELQGTCR